MKIKITIKKDSPAAKAVEAYKANKKAVIDAIKSGNVSNCENATREEVGQQPVYN